MPNSFLVMYWIGITKQTEHLVTSKCMYKKFSKGIDFDSFHFLLVANVWLTFTIINRQKWSQNRIFKENWHFPMERSMGFSIENSRKIKNTWNWSYCFGSICIILPHFFYCFASISRHRNQKYTFSAFMYSCKRNIFHTSPNSDMYKKAVYLVVQLEPVCELFYILGLNKINGAWKCTCKLILQITYKCPS